jgi:dihydroflavonol-4-reductase
MSESLGGTLVIGANGFVGSHVVRQLAGRGRTVRALVRNPAKTKAFDGLSVEVIQGDILEPCSLDAAMQGIDSVFHCALDARFWLSDPSPLFQVNVDGLRNTMDAALKHDVKRFLFTSTIGTLGQTPSGLVNESTPFNWLDRAPPYIRSRLDAENLLLEYCQTRGLPGIAFCIANTYGPQDFGPTPHGHALWLASRGELKSTLDTTAPTVDIRDAAQAMILGETQGRIGERYIIANEYTRFVDLYTLACEIHGCTPPKAIPYKLGYAVATLGEFWFKVRGKRDQMLSRDAIYLSDAFGPMDHTKAKRELGWQPRPLRETVQDAIRWYDEQPSHERDSSALP